MSPLRAEPSSPASAVREEQLLRHARQLFSQRGYRETSLQEIADKLGITRPLFYYYFKSKEDLLWSLIGHVGDELRDTAHPIAESEAPAIDRLTKLMRAHAKTILENSDTFRVYFAERHLVEGQRNRALKKGEDEYFDIISQVIGEAQREGTVRKGNRRVLTHFVTGQINSMIRWFEPGGIMPIEELTELAADVAVHGIAT